ncbi:hypothetical protein QTP70_019989, partial [Hemibagrus guttatus]
MDGTEENRQEYKELQHRVKREVSKAKQKAYDELYTRLDTREGEKDLYRLARQRDRDGKDVQQVRVIKDRDGRVLTSEESVLRRWKEYFEELRSVLVPIFKNKGDMQSCSNYRGIKLMSHTMKLWERVVEARLRKVVGICEQQYGFMPRKSTTDAIFALRILMEKYRDGQRELHCVFVDLEKAYDRVPREELWYCMRKSGVAEKYVRVVQDMYGRSRTVVRCAIGQTEEFKVEVGLHQGSALSPFLFAMVMDQLSEEFRLESTWTMMFAHDIVICSESRKQVEENLKRWRFALERRGMKVSRSKTEYMCVNEREGSGTVRLQGEEVKKVQELKYLGSTVQSNGECGKEVKKRVQAAQQLLYFLRRLRKAHLPPLILTTFYRGSNMSILSRCITAWFGNCTVSDRKTLQRIVRTAEKIIGVSLPTITRCIRKANSIVDDPTHPSHTLFTLLPSGKMYRSIRAHTTRLLNSFFPQAIRKNLCISCVTKRPWAVLSVSPQSWLTEGDSVTLSCEVTDSSTDWTFSWYTVVPYRDGLTGINNNRGYSVYVELLSDSSRGSGGNYTLSPAALKHTGVYMCRGERGEPALHTQYSNPQPLWITGESPPVSLFINPSRTQHFTKDSLSLSCEDQSNSTGWTVRRYTHSERVLDCSHWGSVTGSTCNISFLSTSYTGVYWCESEPGENSNPVNITVH